MYRIQWNWRAFHYPSVIFLTHSAFSRVSLGKNRHKHWILLKREKWERSILSDCLILELWLGFLINANSVAAILTYVWRNLEFQGEITCPGSTSKDSNQAPLSSLFTILPHSRLRANLMLSKLQWIIFSRRKIELVRDHTGWLLGWSLVPWKCCTHCGLRVCGTLALIHRVTAHTGALEGKAAVSTSVPVTKSRAVSSLLASGLPHGVTPGCSTVLQGEGMKLVSGRQG